MQRKEEFLFLEDKMNILVVFHEVKY